MSASEAAKEGIYLDSLMSELEAHAAAKVTIESTPVPILISSAAVTKIDYTPEHAKSKHIERRHMWLNELTESGKIEFPYVDPTDNMAEFFTTPLPPKAFIKMRDRIMNIIPS
jgi:hypothetical protein